MKKMSELQLVKNAVLASCIGKNKEGHIVIRSGFFYTSGRTSENLVNRVMEDLKKAGLTADVKGHDEVWKNFRGGASVSQQSHWWVAITNVRPIEVG